MPLSRNTKPLLKIVRNQPHATADDHETEPSSRHSSPLSDVPDDADKEDYTRDPDSASSGEDEPQRPLVSKSKVTSQPTKNIHTATSRPQNGTKRKSDEVPERQEADWVTSSQSKQRSRSSAKYGSASQRSTDFKLPKSYVTKKAVSSQKTFKRPRTAVDREIKSSPAGPASSQSSFVQPRAAEDLKQLAARPQTSFDPSNLPSSPPLSIHESSDIEEVYLDGDDPTKFEPCPICCKNVLKDFRTDWQLEHNVGKRMSLRKQQEFCAAHQSEEAASEFRQHNYPDVDWDGLTARLKGLSREIEDMLDGKRESHFREEFAEVVNSLDGRTAKPLQDGENMLLRTGYYGGRGARVIVDFASQRLNKTLLRLGAKDNLIGRAGLKGGISGFVHSVVVPEFALALIMEDMDVDAVEGRQILDDSTALGNMRYPELQDHIPVQKEAVAVPYGADGAYR